jgi:hypothetical protein
VRPSRDEVRARLLAMMAGEDDDTDPALRDELRAVIAAGRENPDEAGIIADLFLDRVETSSGVDAMAEYSPPGARPGVYFFLAMLVTSVVLAVAIHFAMGLLGMAASGVLIILFASGMRWLTNWSVEQRYAREEEEWLSSLRPLVVVRTYPTGAVYARDASRMRLLGYEISVQQRVFGGDRVTFELHPSVSGRS